MSQYYILIFAQKIRAASLLILPRQCNWAIKLTCLSIIGLQLQACEEKTNPFGEKPTEITTTSIENKEWSEKYSPTKIDNNSSQTQGDSETKIDYLETKDKLNTAEKDTGSDGSDGSDDNEGESIRKPIEIVSENPSKESKVLGATIRRRAVSTEDIKKPKSKEELTEDTDNIYDIELYLDDEKLNIVNQRRDNKLLEKRPDYFGIEGEFKPLLNLKSKKKGKVIIKGKYIGEIVFDTKDYPEEVEIYPDFKLKKLFDESKENEETIDVIFREGSKETLVDRFTIKCSNENEIFFEDKNLNDIVSISEEQRQTQTKKGVDSVQTLLKGAMLGLDTIGISHEEMPKRNGYLKIREGKDIREEKRANNLDLCVWLSKKAREYNYEVSIIITPDDALLGVKSTDKEGKEKRLYIDPQFLLRKSMGDNPPDYTKTENDVLDWRLNKALNSGSAKIKECFEKNPEKMFDLELSEWEKVYRNIE